MEKKMETAMSCSYSWGIIQRLHSGDPFPVSQGGVNKRKDSGWASGVVFSCSSSCRVTGFLGHWAEV